MIAAEQKCSHDSCRKNQYRVHSHRRHERLNERVASRPEQSRAQLSGQLLSNCGRTAKRAARVEKKTADLVWMRSMAPQVAAARNSGSTTSSNESLVVLIDRTARQAGLGSSLRDQSPNGQHSLRLRLESASFDSLVAWLALLQQQHGVAVETANVDVGSAPGLVNASVTVGQAGAG